MCQASIPSYSPRSLCWALFAKPYCPSPLVGSFHRELGHWGAARGLHEGPLYGWSIRAPPKSLESLEEHSRRHVAVEAASFWAYKGRERYSSTTALTLMNDWPLNSTPKPKTLNLLFVSQAAPFRSTGTPRLGAGFLATGCWCFS